MTTTDRQRQHEKYLWIAFSLTTTFIVVEVVGSILSHSLALLSDAAHLFTDGSAQIISIIAIRLARREADTKRTFGYYRFEILAAMLNACILTLVAVFIFYKAYERFFETPEIHTTGMLLIAIAGLIINIISVTLLRPGSKESLNVKSAYIDAQADMIGSIGVIITAVLIEFTHWIFLDSIMALLIALWILPRTWSLLKESINILLEGVPDGIDLKDIHAKLSTLPGVQDVHDIHVWALTNGKISLTAHLVVDKTHNNPHLLQTSAQLLEQQFAITHSTLQIEETHCNHSHT